MHTTILQLLTQQLTYKRLVPGYEAPVYIAWAGSNRSPLIRVPASRMGTRLNSRVPVDPMANPHTWHLLYFWKQVLMVLSTRLMLRSS